MGRKGRRGSSALHVEHAKVGSGNAQQQITLAAADIQTPVSSVYDSTSPVSPRRSPRNHNSPVMSYNEALLIQHNQPQQKQRWRQQQQQQQQQQREEGQQAHLLLLAAQDSTPVPPNVSEAFIQLLRSRGWQPNEIDVLLSHDFVKSWEPAPQPLPDEDISPALRDYQRQLWMLHAMNERARLADEFRAKGFR